jgi:hypothetical protein
MPIRLYSFLRYKRMIRQVRRTCIADHDREWKSSVRAQWEYLTLSEAQLHSFDLAGIMIR